MKSCSCSPAVQGLTRGRLVPLSVGGLILISILFAGIASAVGPVNFNAAWGRSVVCAEDDCVNFPLASSNTLNVAIATGDAVIVMTRILDCTTNTNMGITITDNGGNPYTAIYTTGLANCGTVDLLFAVHRTLATNPATVLTMTQSNRPTGAAYGRAIFAATAYSGVALFGNTFTAAFTEGSTAFPWAEAPRSLTGSWFIGLFFQQAGNQAIASMQQGTVAGNTLDNFGSINIGHYAGSPGGSTAGGHDCGANVCVLPNFGGAHTWLIFGIEIAPTQPPSQESILLSTAWGWFGIFLLVIVLAGMVTLAYRFRQWRDGT